jgi:DNA-binding transcriptional regulator PaaX
MKGERAVAAAATIYQSQKTAAHSQWHLLQSTCKQVAMGTQQHTCLQMLQPLGQL